MLEKIVIKQPDSNNIGINDNYVYVDNTKLDSDSDNLYDVVFNINKYNEDNEDNDENEDKDEENEIVNQIDDKNFVIGYTGDDYATV